MKPFNSILSLTLLLLHPGFAVATGGTHQAPNVWTIDGPTFEHKRLRVALEYEFSSKITSEQVKYVLFDGESCQEGSRRIPIDNRFLSSQMTLEQSKVRKGMSKAKISLAVSADNIESFPAYEAFDDDHVIVNFCVRFSLYTGDASDLNSLEVNFLETPIKLRYQMKGDFAIALATSEQIASY